MKILTLVLLLCFVCSISFGQSNKEATETQIFGVTEDSGSMSEGEFSYFILLTFHPSNDVYKMTVIDKNRKIRYGPFSNGTRDGASIQFRDYIKTGNHSYSYTISATVGPDLINVAGQENYALEHPNGYFSIRDIILQGFFDPDLLTEREIGFFHPKVEKLDESLILSWDSLNHHTYILEHSDNLEKSSWTKQQGVTYGTGGKLERGLSADTTKFYRLVEVKGQSE